MSLRFSLCFSLRSFSRWGRRGQPRPHLRLSQPPACPRFLAGTSRPRNSLASRRIDNRANGQPDSSTTDPTPGPHWLPSPLAWPLASTRAPHRAASGNRSLMTHVPGYPRVQESGPRCHLPWTPRWTCSRTPQSGVTGHRPHQTQQSLRPAIPSSAHLRGTSRTRLSAAALTVEWRSRALASLPAGVAIFRHHRHTQSRVDRACWRLHAHSDSPSPLLPHLVFCQKPVVVPENGPGYPPGAFLFHETHTLAGNIAANDLVHSTAGS